MKAMPTREEIAAVAQKISKQLADEGRLIEAGWAILRGMAVPPDAPEVQINEMRWAYMAGAQHLFASIIGILDPGDEPTGNDFNRMNLIQQELDAFRDELDARYGSKMKP